MMDEKKTLYQIWHNKTLLLETENKKLFDECMSLLREVHPEGTVQEKTVKD